MQSLFSSEPSSEATLEALKQRNEALTTLLNVSKNVSGTLDVQRVLQETVDGVSQLFDLGSAAIYMREEGELRLAATFPPLPPDFPEVMRQSPVEEHSMIAASMKSRMPLLVPDVREREVTASERVVMTQRNLRTLLFVPLTIDDEVIGAFIVGSIEHPVEISPFEIDLAVTLGNLASLAIKNARLFNERTQYASQLEKSIHDRKEAEAAREKLQTELFQVQKLDAVGQLAGGVAHDFNNQLSGILGYADLLRLKIADEKQQKYVSNIITLAERSASLTRQLLAFSRKGPLQREEVDIHEVIKEVVSMLAHTISRKIELSTTLEAATPVTIGDASQIQNALLNLALNARDAMPNGGKLIFCTSSKKWETTNAFGEGFSLQPGAYVHVEVRDSGTGIPQDTMMRMYEPFYTTKNRGEGTGMGLAAVYGTMKSHQGALDVESELGKGTAFHLYFPTHVPGDAPKKIDSHVVAVPAGEEILVIDDEELVAHATSEYLTRAGYVSHCHTDSVEALAFFKKNHGSISLVVTDIMMPGMSGAELYREIQKIAPQMGVVFVSGHSLHTDIESILSESGTAFIQKPFRNDALVTLVAQLLHR
ncbi:MAG: response regulator [Deltaproteobacteria bacterium]|nr:response regulator [Deltaproteobacteria bacterium]MBN2671549.1 response regulator [Deltaproteobacteria bacterium]